MNLSSQNPYQSPSPFGATATVAYAAETERTAFIRRTYLHLLGAVVAFVGIEAALLSIVPHDQILNLMIGQRFSWLIVLAAFMGAGWLARSWASSDSSPGLQYAGLGLYVVAQAIIFLPLMVIALHFGADGILPAAGIITMILFGGMTGIIFLTKADMSWMGRYLMFAGIAAMVLVVCGMIFSFDLGIIFIVAMIALMCGYIMYDTSNVLHHYRTTQHVAAALALFASLATLLYYVITLLLRFTSSD